MNVFHTKIDHFSTFLVVEETTLAYVGVAFIIRSP